MEKFISLEHIEKLSKYFSSEEIELFKQIEASTFYDLKVDETWKDANFMPGFRADTTKYAYENWKPHKEDVVLSSYLKTGTNWSMEIIRQLLYRDEKSDLISRFMPIPFKQLEIGTVDKLSMLEKLPLQRKLLMTHLPAYLINIERIKQANAKVVCVLRNPKDQCLSWYKYIKKLPHCEIEPFKSALDSGFEKFANQNVQGKMPLFLRPGEWYPDHILSWYNQRNNINIHFMYFEDMKKDLRGQVKQLAEFLEVSVSDDSLNEIVESCTFDNMKTRFSKAYDIHANMIKVNMRKGVVGDWKNYFTVALSEYIDSIVEDKFNGTEIKFTEQL